MKYFALLLLIAATPLLAEPMTDWDHRRLEVLVDNGHESDALRLLIGWAQDPDEETRERAGEILHGWGLKRSQVFKLDAANLPDDVETKLVEQVRAWRNEMLDAELKSETARALLTRAVRIQHKDEAPRVILDKTALYAGLDLKFQLAMMESDVWPAEHAREQAMALGLIGPKLAAIGPVLEQRALPQTLIDQVVAGILIDRLWEFHDWLEDLDHEGGGGHERMQATVELVGFDIVTVLDEEPYASAPVLTGEGQEVLKLWRARKQDAAKIGQPEIKGHQGGEGVF